MPVVEKSCHLFLISRTTTWFWHHCCIVGGSKVDTVSGVIQMLLCKTHKSRENQPHRSKRNKTVPGKVATTRTEDGHK